MAMESNDSLTSYLKSMFVQFHGEEQLQPPSQSPAEAAAPVASISQSAASETDASTDSMAVEGTTSDEQLEDITSLKQLKEANPSQTNDEETDVNNNSEWSAETSPRKLMTNGGNSQQQSTIEVNVDVHHSGNDLIDEEATGNGESVQPVQTTLTHNKIALTFLDELKQTLQGNEGKPSEDAAAASADASSSEQAEESLVVDKASTTIEVEADRLSPDRQEEVTAPSSYSSSSLSPSSPPPSSPGPQPAARTSEQSFSSSSSVAEEATSTTESGIQEDIDDATNSGQSSSTASTPTTESSSAPTDATSSSSSSNRLVRSASSNVLGSTSSLTASNGGPSASGRRMLRSVSQDVRFKLESIKEEKKVTKSHVSELANFWKGKMISPKDNS